EEPLDFAPVRGAFVAEVLRDPRCGGLERLALGDFAVEKPQGISLQPELAVAVQLLIERTVVVLQLLEIRRTALVVTDRVELQTRIVKAGLPQPRARDLDHLRVDPRRGAPDRLDVELEELPVAAFLWPV